MIERRAGACFSGAKIVLFQASLMFESKADWSDV
jgi:hypothetical protein